MFETNNKFPNDDQSMKMGSKSVCTTDCFIKYGKQDLRDDFTHKLTCFGFHSVELDLKMEACNLSSFNYNKNIRIRIWLRLKIQKNKNKYRCKTITVDKPKQTSCLVVKKNKPTKKRKFQKKKKVKKSKLLFKT